MRKDLNTRDVVAPRFRIGNRNLRFDFDQESATKLIRQLLMDAAGVDAAEAGTQAESTDNC